MIAPALADYAVIGIVLCAVILRVAHDIRGAASAAATKKTMKMIVRREFSPQCTILITCESLENTKQTLRHMQDVDASLLVVVVVDAGKHAQYANALRYFVRKNAMKRTAVTVRKHVNLAAVARKYAKTGLVVVLPDTTRLNTSFYYDAILPFGDQSIEALRLPSSVRTGKTLSSGIEVLFAAWRHFAGHAGMHAPVTIAQKTLPEGVIVRVQYGSMPPGKALQTRVARQPVYSVAAVEHARPTRLKLQRSAGIGDYGAALLLVAAILLAGSSYGTPPIVGVIFLLYGILVWWALGAARVAFTDRIILMPLAPFFFVAALGVAAGRLAAYGLSFGKDIKTAIRRQGSTSEPI